MRGRFILTAVGAAILFVLGMASGTQYCASTFHDHPLLGRQLFVAFGAGIYAPWAWLGWSARFAGRAPRTFAAAEAMTFAGGVLALGLVLAVLARLRARPSTAHGSARWATRSELRAAGLLDDAGVVLCQTADARFTSDTDGQGGRRWRLERPGTLIRHSG